MLSFFSKLRNKQISLFMFNVIIAIWLGAILNIGFYKKVHLLTPYLGIKATLFLAASAALAFSLYLSLINFGLFYWILKEDGILHFTVAGAGAMALLSLRLPRKPQAVIPSKNL